MRSRTARRAARLCTVVVLFLVIAASPLAAATLIFNTSDSQFDPGVDNQGNWNTINSFDSSGNYFVGDAASGAIGRSFLTFDLSSLSGTVLSAVLEVVRYNYPSSDPTETLGLFHVLTDAATLNNNAGTNQTIFDDLGTGTSYGTFVVPAYTFSDTETLTFTLNSAAIADINTGAGGFFSIGAALLSFTPGGDVEVLFGLGGSAGIQRLILETAAVPAPPQTLLLGIGLLVLVGTTIIRRKSQPSS